MFAWLYWDGGRLDSRDPKEMAKRWDEAIEPMSLRSLEGAQLIVDAIYGTGLHDDVTGVPAQMIEEATGRNIPVVAIDVPTGIDATKGLVHGLAFKAVATVTFFRRKTGHVLLPGRLYCGDVRAADIGIPATVLEDIAPSTFTNDPEFWLRFFPNRIDAHKYDRGHAVVVSGPMERTGAARLAARTALRSGAGLVTVATSKSAFYINAAQLTAVMVDPYDGPAGLSDLLSDTRITAALIGPGAGKDPEVRELVTAVLGSQATAVLDAEGITAFSEAPAELLEQIKARLPALTIMTPHEGEFKRVFPELEEELSKLERARRAAEISGAVIILKGPDTVTATREALLRSMKRTALACNRRKRRRTGRTCHWTCGPRHGSVRRCGCSRLDTW